jgi:hypothetical protein
MDSKMIDLLKQIGIISASQILLLIVIGFFGKKMIEFFFSETIELKKAELNQSLEAFKQTLATQTHAQKLELDKTLESYKNTLLQISHENQIKFSKLHQERAEVIKQLYSKLVRMEKSMTSFMNPFQWTGEPPEEEKRKIASTDAQDFMNFFEENEVLLNPETCKIINSISDAFYKAWREHNRYLRKSNMKLQLTEEDIDKSLTAFEETLKKEVPSLKEKLKDDFRQNLGVR